MQSIIHNKPCTGQEEIQAIEKVLKKNWLIAGEEVQQFESEFAHYIGSSYAIAVTSGTAALHLSLLALGLQSGDEVITSTYTSADILNAIYYVRAKPVLIDITEDSCLMDIQQIKKKLTKKTRCIIIPHTFGFPADIPEIRQYNIPIIEDCAQAIGSLLNGILVGNFGDVSIFSFFATKLLTTGQGGMIVTNDKKKCDYIKDLIAYNGRDTYKVRYNYPLTDVAAGIGRVQLVKYPEFAKRRKYIAQKYQHVLHNKHVQHFPTRKNDNVVPFRFLLQAKSTKEMEQIKQLCIAHNIEVKSPIAPGELLHRLLLLPQDNFPYAESFASTVISLPLYPCLTDTELDRITSILQSL